MKSARNPAWIAWLAPVVAFCGGLLIGHLPGARMSPSAQAATGLAPLERLVAEDAIRQKIALYGLYADGDGTGGKGRDLRALADTLMTPDVVSEIHPAGGGAPRVMTGREVIAKSPPENDPELAHRIAGRHYLVSTVFDDISASLAHTRTAAVYFDASRATGGVDCGKAMQEGCAGKPVKTIMWVYHMTWRKTPQGWQISRNVLRDDN